MLRLFGAQSTAVGKTVENFPPQWRAAAQWKSRGAETLVALQAQSPSGLKKAAQALRQAFSADLYGAGETTLPAAVVEALERHDKLLICADAAAGALLEARLENLPGAEKVFDFGAVSYANPKTGPLIEKRARARLPKDCTDPLRQALARAQAARRVVGADLSAACAERESDCVLVLSCRKGCFLRTVPAGENPALWLLDIIQRLAVCQPLFQGRGLRLQLGIGHRLILCFQCQHLFGNGIDLFQLPVREAAKEFFSKGHCYTSSIKNRGGRPPNSGKTTYCLYDTPKLKTRQTRWIDFIRFLGELSVNLEKKTLSGIAQQ